jgi:hypothetical protein
MERKQSKSVAKRSANGVNRDRKELNGQNGGKTPKESKTNAKVAIRIAKEAERHGET